jgi:uncharacterized protein YndB with AHSA1/START domain
MSGSEFVYVTYIRITPEKLWRALTTPEIIKQLARAMYRAQINLNLKERQIAS